MKIKTKLFLSFAVLMVIMVAFAAMFVSALNQMNAKQQAMKDITALSTAVLDFNVENFHTQLEIWEYAYEPNQKRLDAFRGHEKTFDELAVAMFKTSKENGQYLDAQSADTLKLIESQIPPLKASWEEVIAAVDPENTQLSEATRAENIKTAVHKGEDFFDESHFNKNVDLVVSAQKSLVAQKEVEIAAYIKSIKQTILMIVLASLLLAVGLVLYFANSISGKLVRLTDAANHISKGDIDIQLPEINTHDEVRDLNESLKGVLAAVRFLKEETEAQHAETKPRAV